MFTGIIIGALATACTVLFLLLAAGISVDRQKEKEIAELKARLIPWQDTDSLQINCKPGMKLLLAMTDQGMRVCNCPEEIYAKIMGRDT